MIGDWFDHDTIRLTLAGIIAKSSNIGTVLAADAFSPVELVAYLQKFGLGQRTDVGVRGETAGHAHAGRRDDLAGRRTASPSASRCRSTSLQMAAAVNTIANGGVRVAPSLIAGSAVTDDGRHRRHRRRHPHPGRQQAGRPRDRPHDGEGRRPRGRCRARGAGARLPRRRQDRHRAAGRPATCGCYDGSTSVSFGGFAPADDARFTVYVVVHAPERRRWWRLDRGPRVLADHGLRPGPLRRRADQRHAVAPARRVVTRYPRPVHDPESATRPQQSPATPATELADWLVGHDGRRRAR